MVAFSVLLEVQTLEPCGKIVLGIQGRALLCLFCRMEAVEARDEVAPFAPGLLVPLHNDVAHQAQLRLAIRGAEELAEFASNLELFKGVLCGR